MLMHGIVMTWVSVHVLVTCLVHAVLSEGPKVTLSHGGQLRGKNITYNGTNIDLFLGVRYAKAPVGALRFSKPQDVGSWSGEVYATSTGNVCSQINYETGAQQRFYGSEDCLFLDITIPGGVQTQNLKPVMVWIHGGAYIMGTGSQYPAAPLAVHGDVIVITMNYRLGIHGFLSDGKGTGNFGLWDQRKALQWIQRHIRAFRGDPNQITLLGETSVAAQIMSVKTSGLFQRAIPMSNGLYPTFGWYMTESRSFRIRQLIRNETDCCKESIYDCFDRKTQQEVEEIRLKIQSSVPKPHWVPIADNDFFAESITNEDYNSSNKVDLLTGFNGQEGGSAIYYVMRAAEINSAIEDAILSRFCLQTNELDMCKENLRNQYGLGSLSSDRERTIKLIELWGEIDYNSDVVQGLRGYSKSDKKTFAYYFTERYLPPTENREWNLPDWAKLSAIYADQLPFMWGYVYTKENPEMLQEYIGDLPAVVQGTARAVVNGPSESDKPLTNLIMTAWTNFATSGNPNEPVALPGSVPAWPEFTESSDDFMRLDSQNYTIISTPNRARLDDVIDNYRSELRKWVSQRTVQESTWDYCNGTWDLTTANVILESSVITATVSDLSTTHQTIPETTTDTSLVAAPVNKYLIAVGILAVIYHM